LLLIIVGYLKGGLIGRNFIRKRKKTFLNTIQKNLPKIPYRYRDRQRKKIHDFTQLWLFDRACSKSKSI